MKNLSLACFFIKKDQSCLLSAWNPDSLACFFLLQKTLSLGCILRMKNPILAAVASVQLFCRWQSLHIILVSPGKYISAKYCIIAISQHLRELCEGPKIYKKIAKLQGDHTLGRFKYFDVWIGLGEKNRDIKQLFQNDGPPWLVLIS